MTAKSSTTKPKIALRDIYHKLFIHFILAKFSLPIELLLMAKQPRIEYCKWFEIFEKVIIEEDTKPLSLEETKSIAKAEQEFEEGAKKVASKKLT